MINQRFAFNNWLMLKKYMEKNQLKPKGKLIKIKWEGLV